MRRVKCRIPQQFHPFHSHQHALAIVRKHVKRTSKEAGIGSPRQVVTSAISPAVLELAKQELELRLQRSLEIAVDFVFAVRNTVR